MTIKANRANIRLPLRFCTRVDTRVPVPARPDSGSKCQSQAPAEFCLVNGLGLLQQLKRIAGFGGKLTGPPRWRFTDAGAEYSVNSLILRPRLVGGFQPLPLCQHNRAFATNFQPCAAGRCHCLRLPVEVAMKTLLPASGSEAVLTMKKPAPLADSSEFTQ